MYFTEEIHRVKRLTPDGEQIRWSLQAGDFIQPGHTTATGIYSWVTPKTKQEKEDNAKAEILLIQAEKDFKEFGPPNKKRKVEINNLVEFYQNYSDSKKMKNNRHLVGSLNQFKLFLKEKKRAEIPVEKVTEEFCTDFRDWLLEKFHGETPANYFARFKQMMKAAIKKGYFKVNPASDVRSLRNEKTEEKVSLSDAEYEKVVSSICPDVEIKRAVVFSLYTGMRWCDVKVLKWGNISEYKKVPTFSIIQLKTGYKAEGPIDKIAFKYMGQKKGKNDLVFNLPSSTWANDVLKRWINDIGIDKKFTWHCCRHSFIMWAKRRTMPSHIIAGIVGHKGEALIHSTYNHYDLESAISIMQPDFKPMKVVNESDEKLALVKEYKSMGFSNEEILQLVG